ncbi:MAG: hypothetical protein ABW278_07875, partial [Steroidobacteraceae bacterium]
MLSLKHNAQASLLLSNLKILTTTAIVVNTLVSTHVVGAELVYMINKRFCSAFFQRLKRLTCSHRVGVKRKRHRRAVPFLRPDSLMQWWAVMDSNHRP